MAPGASANLLDNVNVFIVDIALGLRIVLRDCVLILLYGCAFALHGHTG